MNRHQEETIHQLKETISDLKAKSIQDHLIWEKSCRRLQIQADSAETHSHIQDMSAIVEVQHLRHMVSEVAELLSELKSSVPIVANDTIPIPIDSSPHQSLAAEIASVSLRKVRRNDSAVTNSLLVRQTSLPHAEFLPMVNLFRRKRAGVSL